MTGFQFEIFEDQDRNMENAKKHELEQLSMLPVNPIQYKMAEEEPVLTAGELEILQMALKGSTIVDIMKTIYRSIHGVKWRLCNLYHKFGVPHRLGLIKLASTKGLQFRTESGIKHTFYLKMEIADHGHTVSTADKSDN